MVLVSVVILLLIILVQSVEGQVRRGRTLANPQVIIPNARLTKNNLGGHDYYVKGKRVGQTKKNIHGSYDVYIKGRMKYKGLKFDNTNSSRYNSVYSSGRTSGARHHTGSRNRAMEKKRESERRDEYLKRWSAQRTSNATGRVYWWEHFYPHNFGN